MTASLKEAARGHASIELKHATQRVHHQIETRFDAIAELSDSARRPDIVVRYAALYLPAHAALESELGHVEGLDFASRRFAWRWNPGNKDGDLPDFPRPANRAEALGLLYVIEGSALGGKMILNALAKRGIVDPALDFLDPYGKESGRYWRNFLAVLDREISFHQHLLDQAVMGALRGFEHAETLLCGTKP